MPDASRELSARRLTEINRALTYARSLDDVLELTIDCATELLQASRAVLMLNGEDGLLHVRAARGVDEDAINRFREPLDENLLSRLTGLLGPGARESFLGVPLVVQGNVIGLLAVRSSDNLPPTEEGEWLLSALADQTAVALESTRNDDVRHLLEERLTELQREQEGKNRAIEILSHDLRTPLGAVVGYTALLSAEILGPVNERQQNALVRIKSVCDHMEAVLSNVLEMARLGGGRFDIASEAFDVNDVVATALDVVRPAAVRAGIVLSMSRSSPLILRSDAARLQQVLVQLLDNAIKYSPEGCKVQVTHQHTERGNRHWVQLDVTDQGPGIEADRQREIFEPYVRRDGISARAKSGVGLGLSIARGIVQKLGGSLSVESKPPHGATFRILLPV